VALLDQTDDEWLARLQRKRAAQEQEHAKLWAYYDNEQPLAYVARILQEQGDRFPPLRVNWSELIVAAVEERLDVEGFRLAGADDVDEDLAHVWQDNDLDESSGEAHVASMVTGQAFIMLGPAAPTADTDTPVVTVEYSDQVAVEVDPATRRVIAGLKEWKSDDLLTVNDMAQLFLPGRSITWQHGAKGMKVEDKTTDGWAKQLEAHQTSPLVPVVPMLNRPRRGLGYSELKDVMPLVDAVNQTATNMLAGVEHHALPRRWAINLDPAMFTDEQGNQLKAWQVAAGYLWAVPPPVDEDGRRIPAGEGDRPQIGQFTASDLNNYIAVIRQISTLAASKYGLPPHYLGYSSENPASADAIRSSEARLVKRAERHQRGKGGAWERAMRIALAMMDRNPDEGNRMETVWRDPSTPTASAIADRAVKLTAAGIIDKEQAQEDCGYTPAQRALMNARGGSDAARTSNILNGLKGLGVAAGGAAIPPPPGGQQPPAQGQQPPAPAGPPNPGGNGAAAGAGR
jgi:hypothetical protein